MIFFILACHQFELASFDDDYEQFEWEQSVSGSQLLSDELVTPNGFIAWKQGWLIADQSTGELVHLNQQGERLVVHANLNAPSEILLVDGEAIVACADELLLLSSDEQLTSLSMGRTTPYQLTAFDSEIYWLEEDALWSMEQLIIENLDGAHGLVAHQNGLFISTQNDRKLWRWGPDTQNLEVVMSFTDIPHQMISDNDVLYMTTRSEYWPFGGWILEIDQTTSRRLSESPPEPEQIVARNGNVIWASKQSITKIGEDYYSILAQATSVGTMKIIDNDLIWTDIQAGELRRQELTD